MISHRNLLKSFTKNFTSDHNSHLLPVFPLLTVLSTLFFKAVQFAGSPSQLSETLKSIWHSLRCCRKRGAICQQNSHASKNLDSLLITSQIFCLFSLWIVPQHFTRLSNLRGVFLNCLKLWKVYQNSWGHSAILLILSRFVKILKRFVNGLKKFVRILREKNGQKIEYICQ